MGSLSVLLSRDGPPPVDRIRRMLEAAPHRGSLTHVAVCGQAALGISNPEEHPDASLVERDGMAAVFVGTLDNLTEIARLVHRPSATPCLPTPASILLDAF